jgi:hypothetical protein
MYISKTLDTLTTMIDIPGWRIKRPRCRTKPQMKPTPTAPNSKMRFFGNPFASLYTVLRM